MISPLLANIYLNYLDTLWERHGKALGELTRYADDMVIVCKTKKDADQAYKLLRAIMERLELTLHPEKTQGSRAVDRRRGIRFPRNAPPKGESRNVAGACDYTTQQWLTTKAEKHIREVIKERLAPPSARGQSLKAHVAWLNPKIRGWKNYYTTPYSARKMAKLEMYLRMRLCKWYAKKHKKKRWLSVSQTVGRLVRQCGLQSFL